MDYVLQMDEGQIVKLKKAKDFFNQIKEHPQDMTHLE